MLSIKVKDKTYSFCWGTLAIMNTCDKLGMTMYELELAIMSNDQKAWYTLAYEALVVNDITANNSENLLGKELEGFSFGQFMVWLDNAPEKIGQDIVDSYMSSKTLGRTMQSRYDEIFEKLNVAVEEINGEPTPTVKKKKERLAK